MRIGANWPRDDRSTETTWDLFRALEPAEITITSHEPDAIYERLLKEYPSDRLLWHVKMKGGGGWWPKSVADAEYANERSLLGRATWLIERGVTPYIILGNEPDLELTADPVDNDGNRAHAATAYLNWAAEAIARLRREVPEAKIALAPLSQGNPDRFAYWYGRYVASGLLSHVDFWCEHAYTDGRPYDDPGWGGRPLNMVLGGLPIHVCETNDNGRYATQDPHERAADFAGYARFLRDSGVVESLSLFTLPGGAQDNSKPSWWFVGPEIVTAVTDALATGAAPVILPEVPKMANLIHAVDVSSNNPNRDQDQVNQWVAEGCQLLIVKSYSSAEPVSLAQSTIEWAQLAEQAGCWTLPYCWLYRSTSPTAVVNSAAQLWRTATGGLPAIMFLDAENYTNSDGTVDPGPTVDQFMEAVGACQSLGISAVLYSGNWWLGTFEGDTKRLAGQPAWLAAYNGEPNLNVVTPFGMQLVGHQYTDQPQDWSVFDLDALAALTRQQAAPPATPPESTPDALKIALRAELAVLDGVRERIATLLA